ncbi:helicase-related protein [Oerskovia sp. M15]
MEIGEEVSGELARSRPMQRLLQGEVGSGKTVVALRAMLQVVDAGGQAALLAPPRCSPRSTRARCGPCWVRSLRKGCSAGRPRDARRAAHGLDGAAAKKGALLDAASGRAGIVVGTHALLSENVQFADLGLVVVDEQHRFGVEQRDALRAKARTSPHLLVMTATPIPRTVAMTVFGDLETSSLTEIPRARRHHDARGPRRQRGVDAPDLAAGARGGRRRAPRLRGVRAHPPGRRALRAVGSGRCRRSGRGRDGREEATDRRLRRGAGLPRPRPRRDRAGSDRPPLRAVLEVAEELASVPRCGARRRGPARADAPADKEKVMADFASGAVQVLVSTTVVEVGVDVPEATVMVVFDADRFGLSQLHQLRGRVGRGSAPGSACWSRPSSRVPLRPSGSRPWRRPPTGSASRPWTSSCAARATCWARRSPARPARCGCCASSRTSR